MSWFKINRVRLFVLNTSNHQVYSSPLHQDISLLVELLADRSFFKRQCSDRDHTLFSSARSCHDPPLSLPLGAAAAVSLPHNAMVPTAVTADINYFNPQLSYCFRKSCSAIALPGWPCMWTTAAAAALPRPARHPAAPCAPIIGLTGSFLSLLFL